jgi:membrane protein
MQTPGSTGPSFLERVRDRAAHAAGRAWKLTERSVRAFAAHRCSQLAASISYYALLSIFPAAIVTAVIFGIVIDDASARASVVEFLFDNLPVSEDPGRGDLEKVVDGVTDNTGTLGVIGVATLLYSSSALMASVRNSFAIIGEREATRPALRAKALDILLVLGLGVLIGLSLAVTILRGLAVDFSKDLGFVGRVLQGVLDATGFVIPFTLAALAFAAILVIVPYPRPRLRDVWPGILVAAIGYELAKGGFALYLENFGDYSVVYGSIGAVITFLVFVYIAAMVLLLGGEYAALWPRVRSGEFDGGGKDGKPFGRQVRDALRSLVVEDRDEEPDKARK